MSGRCWPPSTLCAGLRPIFGLQENTPWAKTGFLFGASRQLRFPASSASSGSLEALGVGARPPAVAADFGVVNYRPDAEFPLPLSPEAGSAQARSTIILYRWRRA